MSQPVEDPKGDPWRAFGYIVAGVAFYGVLGFVADQWLGTRFLVAIGIVGGAALGIYMTAARLRTTPAETQHDPEQDTD
jgi:hypothetical protein